MTDNLYAPPQADLNAPHSEADGRFYVVSKAKFFVLFICSLGLYQIYWSYKNWSQYKASTQSDIWPVARGIFAIFFVHALYRNVEQSIQASGRGYRWDASLWATLFVIVAVLSNVLETLVRKNIGGSLLVALSTFWVFAQVFITWQGQQAINFASGDPEGAGNAHFSPANYLVIVLGGIVWVFALIGIFALLG
ncbi:hypothetical protein [Pseudomonas vanderleydeniana]|uniref:DUF4234 domain-containing protein n=1 Tax=Pseudomonas vanderleydeniana TaxID=2745495 RepID=A0A9E6TRY6_9PSED|nr:hypothetical protein [Pseudomonas vanderleydeniana]QXI27660.1 hypothetical protein HU752_027785 [Pseudomonas vanderleydeniana]